MRNEDMKHVFTVVLLLLPYIWSTPSRKCVFWILLKRAKPVVHHLLCVDTVNSHMWNRGSIGSLCVLSDCTAVTLHYYVKLFLWISRAYQCSVSVKVQTFEDLSQRNTNMSFVIFPYVTSARLSARQVIWDFSVMSSGMLVVWCLRLC